MKSMNKIIFLLPLVIFMLYSAALIAQCTNCNGTASSPNQFSSAIGNYTKAGGFASFASGSNVSASGYISTGIGSKSHAMGDHSITLGSHLNSVADGAMLIGRGFGENPEDRLHNNNENSLMIGFNSIYPTLYVGPSPSKNITGRVGIGNVIKPQAKLHIFSEAGETVGLFIEQDDFRACDLFLGTMKYGFRSSDDHGLVFKTAKNYVFDEGRIGIGTHYPEYDLDVKGDIFTKEITIFDRENYQDNIEGWILRSDAQGKAYWTDPSLLDDGDWLLKDNTAYRTGGSVGIGTNEPVTTLELNHNLYSGGTAGLSLANGNLYKWFIGMTGDRSSLHDLLIGNFDNLHNGFSSFVVVKPNGDVGMGTAETYGYKLAVDGAILTEEVTVKMSDNWPDYVFDDNYKLASVSSLKSYIGENGHLPGIPTANEITTFGLKVGEMQRLLLEKVEELTLYIIGQEEKIQNLEARIGKQDQSN